MKLEYLSDTEVADIRSSFSAAWEETVADVCLLNCTAQVKVFQTFSSKDMTAESSVFEYAFFGDTLRVESTLDWSMLVLDENATLLPPKIRVTELALLFCRHYLARAISAKTDDLKLGDAVTQNSVCYGEVCCEIQTGVGYMHVYLPPGLFRKRKTRVDAKNRTQKMVKNSRHHEEAVANLEADLSVSLSLETLSFADLAGLKPGSILLSNVDFGNQFNLVCNNQTVGKVGLGKVGLKKAIKLM